MKYREKGSAKKGTSEKVLVKATELSIKAAVKTSTAIWCEYYSQQHKYLLINVVCDGVGPNH